MFDWDVIIIGGGPAGLTAGLYLGRAKRRTLLLDKDSFGGYIKNVELIENYPGFADGIAGPQLASEMVNQAAKYGLRMETAEVTGIELFSNCRWVACTGGQGYTTSIVIIAGGSQHKKLGVPGEGSLKGKGVFNCGFCDGGHYTDQVVAVCGGGDAGVTEALYMAKIASKVILIEAEPELTAAAVLQERASANPKLEIFCGMRVRAIADNIHQTPYFFYPSLVFGVFQHCLESSQISVNITNDSIVHVKTITAFTRYDQSSLYQAGDTLSPYPEDSNLFQ